MAILIKNDLPFSVLRELRSEDDNFVLLKVVIHNIMVIIGAIYGPNTSNIAFYDSLNNAMAEMDDFPTLLGGDWNTSFSTLPDADNPDICNIISVPTVTCPMQTKIKNICSRHKLTDPFRTLWPLRRDLSNILHAVGLRNQG